MKDGRGRGEKTEKKNMHDQQLDAPPDKRSTNIVDIKFSPRNSGSRKPRVIRILRKGNNFTNGLLKLAETDSFQSK
jgi:hypothetical protein